MFIPRGAGALAIVLLSIIARVKARAPSRIIGGTDAAPGEFPWQVSLRAYDTHLCGGTIISKRHILTAAHCIQGVSSYPYSEMTVVTGSNTLKPGTGKAYRVKDIVIHSQYSARTKTKAVMNDIAVISLRKEIEINPYQKAIDLPITDIPNGAKGIVTGFGRTVSEDKRSSTLLQKLEVTIMRGGSCLENGIRVQANQICGVKGAGYGSCKGDSGGPLVYDNAVVGIVSTSIIPCGRGIPDVYTKVYHYVTFIREAMAKI